MKSKFNIGDEIFYMNFNEPKKSKVIGIAFIIGDFKNSSFEKKGEVNNPSITYSVGGYSTVDEKDAFANKEELQNHLFAKL